MWTQEHQYALNIQNQWVDARKIPFVCGATYFCDCPIRHRLKHVKPKDRMHCFAHINPAPKNTKRGNVMLKTHMCTVDSKAKALNIVLHKLREYVNSLAFALEKC
jgi:hypothetical protein